ncbi:MAG: NAD(+) diphosphatase [marine benthic group bacterium]|nr:NAD(+) diphosphatase [Gemmatimonadota bacterium]
MSRIQAFTGNPFDRAAALRREPDWVLGRLADPASRFLLFRDLSPLLRQSDDGLRIDWRPRPALGSEAVLLGIDGNDIAHFAVEVAESVIETGVESTSLFVGTRAAAAALPARESAIVAQARSLLSWHINHPICSRCGGPTDPVEGGYSRRCSRTECGASHFPRTDPVVIMMVVQEDRALFGRSVRVPPFPPGLYSCLAGYVEPGESVEEAVRREVREEAGIETGQVVYHSSQPWPFPSSLMLGCFAEALTEAVRIDPVEVEEVRWFSRSEVKAALSRWPEPAGIRLPPPMTAAHRLVRAWLESESEIRFTSRADR